MVTDHGELGFENLAQRMLNFINGVCIADDILASDIMRDLWEEFHENVSTAMVGASVLFLTLGRQKIQINHKASLLQAIFDGFAKSPISALRFIPRHCGVP